jgi:hypothetical protein
MRYELTTAEGTSCCKSDDPKLLCEHCRAALDAEIEQRAEATPPNPYLAGLKTLAAQHPDTPFEAQWKRERAKALAEGKA